MATRELKWFGYFLVREGVMEPQECRDLMPDDSDDLDFVDYAQLIVDEGFCDDYELIQTLVDQSFSKGQEDDEPPVDIFKPPPAPSPPPSKAMKDEALPVATPDASSTDPPPTRLRLGGSATSKKSSTAGPIPVDDDNADAESPDSNSGLTLKPLSANTADKREKRTLPAPKGAAVPLKKHVGEETVIVNAKPPQASRKAESAPPDEPPGKLSLKPKTAPKEPAATPPPPATTETAASAEPAGRRPNALQKRSEVQMPDMAKVLSGGTVPSVNSAIGKSPAEAGIILARILVGVRAHGASDLHISAGAKPFFRKALQNEFLEDEIVDPQAAEALNLALLSKEQREEFIEEADLDYALALDDENRFRVNLMHHREGIAGSYRLVPNSVTTLEELGFRSAKIIESMLTHHNGLILVTGPVGSGKTTTLAALVDILNRQREDHIITVEEPIEIVQRSIKCNVTQREVGKHTRSFFTALKGALREDPDIIVIGELRDLETIEMAITAAETGHLVIGTLHTSDAATTLNRILDVFPPSQQAQIRSMTAESLRGVICQRLLPTIDGGVTVAEELLISTIAVSNIISDGKMHQLNAVLETGSSLGMRTMDQSVQALYLQGAISLEVALANMVDDNLKKRLQSGQAGQPPPPPGEAPKTSPKQKKGWFK